MMDGGVKRRWDFSSQFLAKEADQVSSKSHFAIA